MSVLSQMQALDDVQLVCLLDVPADTCEQVVDSVEDLPLVLNTEVDLTELGESESLHEVSIPEVFDSLDSRIQFAVEVMREEDVVDVGDEVAIVAQLPAVDRPVVGQVPVSDDFLDDEVQSLFFESEPSVETIQEVLKVAMSLSRTGQKGEPVGVLFVVGDEETVLEHSRPLNHNPFSGADVFIGDDVSMSIGEFAKLDGAFVISSTGRVVSASRYLEPRVHDAEVPSGLGARHMAASGITKTTDAVSVVVSESDQKVRCFVDGEIVVEGRPDGLELL